MNKKNNFLLGTLGLGLLASCAHDIKKADLPDNISPEDALSRTERLQETARKTQADVLAYEDFERGSEYLEEARESIEDGDEASEVLENAAYAQAFFEQSIANASLDATTYDNILSARSMAVSAGAFNNWESSEKIRDTDDDLRDESDNFSKEISPEKTAMLQQKYLDIEVMAVQHNELGKAWSVLTLLEDKGAAKFAPATYKRAQEDILLAKNLISKSPRDASVYNTSVYTALQSTVMLRDVMEVVAQNGTKTPESAAIKIVQQNRKIGQQQGNVAALGSAILNQADKIAFQNAMNNVRKFFSEDEAEVYQQGNKLLIRLKKINFPVGKAVIPDDSKDLLTRINTIVGGLNPTMVEVQGHTDSTGSQAVNEKLSKERAMSVAQFFKEQGLDSNIGTEGFGPNKPLADNQTKQGRATNRRVDIVISTIDSDQVYSE